jgi:hypothetical protein
MSVITDDTGLHAEACGCLRCELGYRPTPRERELARRALAEAAAAKARMQREAPKPDTRLSHTVRPMTPIPPPMTAEQLAELRADIERMKGGRR